MPQYTVNGVIAEGLGTTGNEPQSRKSCEVTEWGGRVSSKPPLVLTSLQKLCTKSFMAQVSEAEHTAKCQMDRHEAHCLWTLEQWKYGLCSVNHTFPSGSQIEGSGFGECQDDIT